MSQKTLTLLGFASKAGKLSFGMSAAETAIKSGKAKLIISAGDISAKSQKEITYTANKYDIPVRVIGENIETLSSAVGRRCGIIAVNDLNFAQSISSQEEE